MLWVGINSNQTVLKRGIMGTAEVGTFTDERDGQVYRTVKMPDGKIWMAQNLNFETEEGSWWYDNNPANGITYGRLYNWEAAKAAVPAGWHLPSCVEWDNMCQAAGGMDVAGKMLKSTSGWNDYIDWDDDEDEEVEDSTHSGNGTDDYGFSALPGGDRFGGDHDNFCCNGGDGGYWWTSTEYKGKKGKFKYAYCRGMYCSNDHISGQDSPKDSGFSVRCVKDD